MTTRDERLWLVVELAAKFRFMGVTLGTLSRVWRFEMPEAVLLLQPMVLLRFDERGVRLGLSLARSDV